MKLIPLFDITMRTLGYALVNPQKSPHQSHQSQRKIPNPKNSSRIANFNPQIGLCLSPSLLYLRTPPLPPPPRSLGEGDVYPVETKGK